MKTKTQINHSGLKNRSEQLSTEESSHQRITGAERKDTRLPINHNERKQNRSLPTFKVLHQLFSKLPHAYSLAEVVGKWVWVQFQEIPAPEIRQQLAQLGFHWNRSRKAWQHPCGLDRKEAGSVDPHQKYRSYFPAHLQTA